MGQRVEEVQGPGREAGLAVVSLIGLPFWRVPLTMVLQPGGGTENALMLQEGGSLPGPRVGSCLTLGNELSKEIHVLTRQETLLGRCAWVESRRVGEPRRTALPRGPWGEDEFEGRLWPFI